MENRRELVKELAAQCKAAGLDFDCPPDGAFLAKVAVVGEYPGEHEVKAKRPMMGPAGRLLWSALEKVGIKRHEVYVTNVIKRQISAGPIKKSITASELQHWEHLLQTELLALPNLDIIISLGNISLNALHGHEGVNNWRGSVDDVLIGIAPYQRRVLCLVANNPAAALRNTAEELPFRFHIGKVQRLLEGTWKKHEIVASYDNTFADTCRIIDSLHSEAIRTDNPLPVAFDIECLSNETACIGFANNDREGYCINFRDRTNNLYTLKEEGIIYHRIQQLLGDERVKLIAQNGNFDSYWLWYKDRIRVHRVWFDTMLAHHLLYPRLPHNLGFLTTQYTDHPFYKDEGKEWREGGDISSFWNYNVKDCCITYACHEGMVKELKRAGLEHCFYNHVMQLQPHLVRMTVLGLRVDTELKHEIADELEHDVAKLRHKFHEAVHVATQLDDYNPSPNSPKQMQELYFQKLRLIGRGASVDKTNRIRMMNHPRTSQEAKEVLRLHDQYTTDSKFLSTYANMRIDPDNRVRCEYKQTGVQSAPGRLSSAAVMWGSGMNLQNQPARAQPMFIADDGHVFCYFDLSQAEARVVAWLADIEQWKEQFERARQDGKYDCHRALASEMFKVPYEEVPTKDRDETGEPTIRFIAKRCRHGLNYRMGADKLATVTGLTATQAQVAYNTYHRITPELRTWWDNTIKEAITKHILTTPYGRRLVISGRIEEGDLDAIVAFRPQSTIGDKVSEVLYLAESDKEWPETSRVVLNIHDALIAQSTPENAKTTLSILKKYAEAPLIINGEELIIPAELGISQPDNHGYHRWSTIKKIASLEEL